MRSTHFILATLSVTMLLGSSVRAAVTITDVRLIDYRIERTKKFVTAKGSSDACYGIFVLISAKSDDGKRRWTALGDALPRGTVTNETLKDAWAGALVMRKALVGRSIGGTDVKQDVQAIGGMMSELKSLANRQTLTTKKPPPSDKQLHATLCGFDIALVDLVAQVHDVPVYEVLGGKRRDAVQVSAPTFNANESADSLAEKVEDADESFQAMRIKIGLEDDADVERVVAVAKELASKGQANADVWVDVNQAWKTAEKSIQMLSRIRAGLKEAGYAARFICEQPTIETDLPALAATTAQTRKWNAEAPNGLQIVTCADEAVWTLEDARKMVQLQAADMVNIKIQKSGGLLESMEIGNFLAEAAPKIEVYVGGVVATDITSWANLQLCYALPRLDYATGCVPRRTYPVNVATDPVAYVSGDSKTLKAPTRSGLGTALNLDKLGKYIKHDTANANPTTAP